MHKLESAQENEIHQILWDFEIQREHPILARRLDLVLINKKKRTCYLVDYPSPVDYKVKMKESEKINKYLDLA